MAAECYGAFRLGAKCMTQVTLEEAGARLPELIESAKRGEETVILRDNNIVVARRVSVESERKPREPGSTKSLILYMADDFDAPLDEFAAYM
jgi:antitoxin (DNA-binding transcriptional repressor) of toxin-antitoxin stability system